jgi:hypothetical protein
MFVPHHMPSNSAKNERKVWGIEPMVRAVKAVGDKKMSFENLQCTKSNTERNWHDFSQHSVCRLDISSQRIGEERNGCAALKVAMLP